MGIGGLEQYGLLGMVGLLVAKEALSWFRKKEDSESKLVETLVADLRRTQEQLISKLFDLHVQQHQDLGEVKEALHDIRDRLDKLV